MEIGRVCMKVAGRDSGKICVIVDQLEKNFVLIDGETRRKKCNVIHLEPLEKVVDLKKGASHEDVAKACKELKITVRETKPKKAAARPKSKRVAPSKKVQKEKPKAVKAPAEEKKPAPKKEGTPKTEKAEKK